MFGNTLAIWFTDQGDEQNAAAVDMTISDWRKLRDQTLLEKSRFLLQWFQQVVDGPNAPDANECGITVEGIQRLSAEINGYADVISAPQQSIANSAGLRKQLRGRFNEVEKCFGDLDRLIHHFDRTSQGRNLTSAYQASRVIIDRGHRFKSPQSELEGAANQRHSDFVSHSNRKRGTGSQAFVHLFIGRQPIPRELSCVSTTCSQPKRRPAHACIHSDR